MNYIWIGFVGGVLAFAHCLGMCGGFALHLAHAESRRAILTHQLLWHLGKTCTYVFLGALAAFAGLQLAALDKITGIQNIIAYLAGGLMILMGLVLGGFVPMRRQNTAREQTGLLSSLFGQFFAKPTPVAALVLGVATGFLPCPIVWGFLALSIQSQSVAVGMIMMAALGAGTIWSLMLLGLTGYLFTIKFRRRAAVFAAIVLMLLGGITIARGTQGFHHLLGCSCENQTSTDAAINSDDTPPCCSSHSNSPPADDADKHP
jgi:uncharacterized protein